MALLVTVEMHCTNKLCDHTQKVSRVEDAVFKSYDKQACDKCGFKTLSHDEHTIKGLASLTLESLMKEVNATSKFLDENPIKSK